MPRQPGTTIGRYQIVSSLGAGGMGEVYRALDPELGREVAIKVLPDEVARDTERLERFEREARVLASLNHPHIVTIHSVEADDGVRFFTMERVDGHTLQGLLVNGALDVEQVLGHGVAIADALSAAHRRGVTHRDLKPANIMVNEEGWLKVLDFGLARASDAIAAEGVEAATEVLTGEGHVLGTVPYMSPEQLQGRPPEPPSDVFSLGIVLYEMATGSRPFQGESQAEEISSILRDTPSDLSEVSSSLPAKFAGLVHKCLQKDAGGRYESAVDVHAELQRIKADVDSASSAKSLSGSGRIQAIRQAYRTPMIGREAEAKELREFLEQAKGGQGALVSLTGEPGVGKSRLSWDLIEHAREQGFFTLVGNCYEGEGMAAYTPWVEVLETSARRADPRALRELLGDAAPEVARLLPELRRLFPDMPAPLELPPEEARRYLFRSFCEFLDRSGRLQPLLIILEDVHWSDEPSLLLMQHVAQQVDGMAILVVATYRDVELDVHRPLARALRELVRSRLVHPIVLRRLTEEGVAGILASLSGRTPPPKLTTAVYDETEGNPFFVEEVYAHLNEERRLFDDNGEWRTDLSLETLDVPEGVRLVVGRRLERLDTDGLKVLTAAAVLGRRFSYSVLEATAGVDADQLLDVIEEAESLSLVEAESASGSREARYHFAHELIRQTLLQGLSVPRRQRLHLRIAAVLEAKPDADERAAPLSYHLYEAGAAADADKTVHYLVLAARQAIETAAFEEALRRLDLVVDVVDERDDARWAEVCRLRGLAHRNLDHMEEAAQEWERALEIYLRRQMLREGVDVAHQLGWLYGFSAKSADAERVAHQALETLNPEGADRCILLADAAAIAGLARRATAAAALVAEVESLSEQIDDEAARASVALDVHATLVSTGQFRAAEEAGAKARVLLTDAVSTYDRTGFLLNQAIGHALRGNWASALACIAECRPLAERIGNWEVSRSLGNVQEWVEFPTEADPAGALRLAEADLAMSRERQIGFAAYTFLWMGLARLWMGDLEQALECAEQGAEKEVVGQVWYGANQGFLLLCRGHGGDREAALGLWSRLSDHVPAAVGVSPSGTWVLAGFAVEAWALLGEHDLAASLYPALLHGVSLGLRATPTLPIQTVVGIAAACGGQWAKAEEHFELARQDCEDLPHIPGAAETRYWQAWALIEQGAAGNDDRATTLLEEAVERFRAIGMPKHEARAADLLARAKS